MSTMTMETLSAGSYYDKRVHALQVAWEGIRRAMENGEDPRKIENARVDVLDLEAEIRELEAKGHSTSWW